MDWIATDLVAGTTYQLSAKGAASNSGTLTAPELSLIKADATGVPISMVQVATNPDIVYQTTITETGRYYLVVEDAAGITTGSYTVTQASKDLHSQDIDTTGRIEIDGTGTARVTGEINSGTDRDWFKVELNGGQAYRFDLQGAANQMGTLADPLLEIRSATGILLQSQSASAGDATLNFQAPVDGAYFVSAGSSSNSNRGTYQIVVRGIDDDHGNDRSTMSTINLDSPEDGLIQSQGDTDWFAASLLGGTSYVLRLNSDYASADMDPLSDLSWRFEMHRAIALPSTTIRTAPSIAKFSSRPTPVACTT